jgi:hypothetical protein
VISDLVDWDNVRVFQAGDRVHLLAEAPSLGRAGELARAEHFEGDHPVEADLPGAVHHSHPAPGDLLEQFVIPEVTDPRSGRNLGYVPADHGRSERSPIDIGRTQDACKPLGGEFRKR